ncbi:MAG: hypothetical protein QOD92_3846 [Acidimicrobiaceae bacterium]|jgi:hypothetical protein
MIDLDTMARGAVDSLHDSVRDVQAPVTRSGRPVSRRPAGLAIVAVVLVAVAGLSSLRGGDDRNRIDVTTHNDVPRFLPTVLPPGFVIDTVQDTPHAQVDLGYRSQIIVYGDPSSADPFAGGDLMVQAHAGPNVEPGQGDQSIDVSGHPATLYESDGFVQLWVTMADHVNVQFTSRKLSSTDVIRFARATTVDDDLQLTVPSPPAGLREVARSSSIYSAGAVIVQEGTVAHEAVYVAPAEGLRQIVVETTRGGQAQLLIARLQAEYSNGADWEPTTVRGHAAVRRGDGVNSTMTLLWQETPDVLVAVDGMGVSTEALAATAEGLARVSDAEWARLPQFAPAGAPTGNDASLRSLDITRIGGFAQVTAETDGRVCVQIDTPQRDVDTCVDPSSAPALQVVRTLDNVAVLWGVVPGRVDSFRTLLPNQNPYGGDAVEVPGRSYRIVGVALYVSDPQTLQLPTLTIELGLFDSESTESTTAPVG